MYKITLSFTCIWFSSAGETLLNGRLVIMGCGKQQTGNQQAKEGKLVLQNKQVLSFIQHANSLKQIK